MNVYIVGEMVFKSSKEGAEYIECSVAVFLRRYREMLAGTKTPEEVLIKGKTPRMKWRDYGTEEWRKLGNKPRPENLTSPEPTEYDELFTRRE